MGLSGAFGRYTLYWCKKGMITKIGNVTKVQDSETSFVYIFPDAQVRADSASGNIRVRYQDAVNGSTYTDLSFPSLSEKYGTTDAVSYVDLLATNGFFSSSVVKGEKGDTCAQGETGAVGAAGSYSSEKRVTKP